MPRLLISVRFHDGRYHGSGEWPPSPARLFQALVAGAARGKNLSEHAVEAFEWLENLEAPAITAPSAYAGQAFKNFVPNNDLDAVGGDPSRINEIRAGKVVRPRTFDAATPLLYAWTFEQGADVERHAQTICQIADCLYQFGRGIDMAWARSEVVDEGEADTRLRKHAGVLWRPNGSGDGAALSCPHLGSLASLTKRFTAMRERFRTVGEGKKARLLFSQAPKPSFGQVSYNSPPTYLLFDIKKADTDAFAAQRAERIVALAEDVRNRAAARLKTGLPDRAALIDRVFIGRDAGEADKAQRTRITPLPSIGHVHVERSIRRVLVTVPPDCPIAIDDIGWAFSGLPIVSDNETGEIAQILAPTGDSTMLRHYGVEDAAPARLWRTITPAALPGRAARRRIEPTRIKDPAEQKGGVERLREHAAAESAARQALRHAGIDVPVEAIRVQREPFEGKGQRAECFAPRTRFAKEQLWHVEIAFARPVEGPLLIGDGRYLGLGLMRPVRRRAGVLAFTIADGLMGQAEPQGLTRALRRAVMARVQETMGERATLPAFFAGHATDGAPARSGSHQHLAFAFDAPRRRLMVIAPHVLERREASQTEHKWLDVLERALSGFCELRAGTAGRLSLSSCHVEMKDDPLFARSSTWENLTPYRVTRHAKLRDAAAALEADLLAECRRAGFPRPRVEVTKTFTKSGVGLFGLAKLRFHGAAAGPILLGRDRHFGGGLFVVTE